MTSSRARGALLGVAGGAAGLVAMRYVMKGAQRLLPVEAGEGRHETVPFVSDRRRRGEDATTALGRAIFTKVARREPGGREKQLMGYAIHWGYGLALAAGYGMLRGSSRHAVADLAGGALFGIGLWGVSDEIMVPLLGLSDRPGAIPPKLHAQALAGHIGYGVATAATLQGLNRIAETLAERRERGESLLPAADAREVRERLAARLHR